MGWRKILPLILLAGIFLGCKSDNREGISLAITHVAIIDATGAPPRPDMTVLIRGDRIAEIVSSRDADIPPSVRLVDGSGKYLVPGFWDMHVHLTGAGEPNGSHEFLLPLLLANGVTSVRDMGGYLESLPKLREELSSGKLLGPEIVAYSGPYVDGPKPAYQPAYSAANPEEARQAVARLVQQHVDFIKIQTRLPRDAYFAAADEAKRRRIPFVGHVPDAVTVAEASDAGQGSIEHLTGVLVGCSSRTPEFQKFLLGPDPPGETVSQGLARSRAWQRGLLHSYSNAKADALHEQFKRNHTWQVPTLIILQNFGFLAGDRAASLAQDSRLAFVPAAVRKTWEQGRRERLRNRGAPDFALRKETVRKSMEVVGAMNRVGVELMAGTDTPAPFVFPGSSLHEELALLVASGLTPMQALQSATRNPARFLGRQDSTGTIETGKRADLVFLDADPLTDIQNTKRIIAVVLHGKLLQRADLDAILAHVKSFAASH